MTNNVIRIPPKTQAYLEAIKDSAQDKHDVISMEFDYLGLPVPDPWAYWSFNEEGCVDRIDATGGEHNWQVKPWQEIWPDWTRDFHSNNTYLNFDDPNLSWVSWSAQLWDQTLNQAIAGTYVEGTGTEPNWDISLNSSVLGGAPPAASKTIAVDWSYTYMYSGTGPWTRSGKTYVMVNGPISHGGSLGGEGDYSVQYKSLGSTLKFKGLGEGATRYFTWHIYDITGELLKKPADLCPLSANGIGGGKAIKFDWEYRELTGLHLFQFAAGQAPLMSFGFWVYITTDMELSISPVSGVGLNIHFYYDPHWPGCTFEVNYCGLDANYDPVSHVLSGWVFLSGYYDGAGLHIEINNVEVASDMGTPYIEQDATTWTLWTWNSNIWAGEYFLFDEFGIWKDVSLTSEQRSALYNNGAGLALYS